LHNNSDSYFSYFTSHQQEICSVTEELKCHNFCSKYPVIGQLFDTSLENVRYCQTAESMKQVAVTLSSISSMVNFT